MFEKVAPKLKKIQNINNDENIFVFTKIKTMQLQEPYCLAITTVYTYSYIIHTYAAKSHMPLVRYTTTRNKTANKWKNKHQLGFN